jgi:hypothetical protein
MRECVFFDCDLGEARWRNCQLDRAKFRGTKMWNATFDDCRLFAPEEKASARFRFVDLREAKFALIVEVHSHPGTGRVAACSIWLIHPLLQRSQTFLILREPAGP